MSDFLTYSPTRRALGILKAAKNDYENGQLFELRRLVEAEVFDDFLEQAESLHGSGYYQAAAVIASGVLEDGLRKLCHRHHIKLPAKPKIDGMYADLPKAGVYDKFNQKGITALADLRNNAAHGQWNMFSSDDVEDMLRKVRRFMEEHFV